MGIELVGVSGGFGCAIVRCADELGETEEAADPGSVVIREVRSKNGRSRSEAKRLYWAGSHRIAGA